jgi:hypothetical protein
MHFVKQRSRLRRNLVQAVGRPTAVKMGCEAIRKHVVLLAPLVGYEGLQSLPKQHAVAGACRPHQIE